MDQNTENTSGQGKNAEVPQEIKGWCWGGFLLTWIWGIGNSTFRAFWCFVPIVNIFMWIALGIKGREWAWKFRYWQSVDHFKRVQKKWSIAGFVILIIGVIIFIVALSTVFGVLNHATPTKMALKTAQSNIRLERMLGTPIEKSGMALGQIEINNGQGRAHIEFPIKGPKSSGKIAFKACRVSGQWYITRIRFISQAKRSYKLPASQQAPCHY